MSAVFNIGSKIWTLQTIFDEKIPVFMIIISLGIDFFIREQILDLNSATI